MIASGGGLVGFLERKIERKRGKTELGEERKMSSLFYFNELYVKIQNGMLGKL